MTTAVTESRIEHAKHGLDEKLAEIERRVVATKKALDPQRLLESPWFRFGVAFAVGFAAGYGRDSAVIRTGMRIVLTASAKHLLQDALERQ